MTNSGSPSQFGKYSLQRKLAEGGMAEVFLAKQTGMEGFEKLVVVKRILPQLCSDDSFVKMFLNEARVAARLNHPNVVQIFDLGKLSEQYFIAMEYVHGEDLRTVIREATDADKRPSLGLACRVIADTLGGLHYAHTRVGGDGKPLGLVHRDVSPQNVLITYEGSVKLVDFGIAKATREVGAAQTQAGLLKGKYSYMSPEQARGQPIDARADVFCAGVLLWELATWQRLFKRPTDMATLMAVAEEPIRAPRTVDETMPPELDRLIMKALARNPEERFATAQEMRAALEALIRTSGWEADTLALSTWMRELFAGKLRAQAADVAASGLASLEDFLLTVEEKTSISWMAQPAKEGEKKTPSTGLPPSRPVSGPHAPTPLPVTPGAAPTPLYSDGATVPIVARSNPQATTLKGGDPVPALPPAAGVIVPSLSPLKATPTAATAGVVIPDAPAGGTPSMNLAPGDNPLPQLLGATSPMPIWGGDKATAKRSALLGDLPSPLRRVLVAGGAGLLVLAVGLTITFWPSKDNGAGPATGGASTATGTAVTGAAGTTAAGAAGTTAAGVAGTTATTANGTAGTRHRRAPPPGRASRRW